MVFEGSEGELDVLATFPAHAAFFRSPLALYMSCNFLTTRLWSFKMMASFSVSVRDWSLRSFISDAVAKFENHFLMTLTRPFP